MSLKKISKLIATGDKNNIDLAFQLIEGNYKEMLEFFNPIAFVEDLLGIDVSLVTDDKTFMKDEAFANLYIAVLMLGGMTKTHAEMAYYGYHHNNKVEIDAEGCGGVSDMYQAYQLKYLDNILEDYRRNQIEVGFKYLYVEDRIPDNPKEVEKGQKKLLKSLRMELIHEFKDYKYDTEYEVFATKDRKVFIQARKGRFAYGEYSSMFGYDRKKTLRILKKIMDGKTPIIYVKNVEVFNNGLSSCDRHNFKKFYKQKNK